MKSLIGKNVFIRTVTAYHTGHLEDIEDGFAVLSNAAWISDTGRFSVALATGQLNEVEMFPVLHPVHVAISAIVDVTVWAHPLTAVSR